MLNTSYFEDQWTEDDEKELLRLYSKRSWSNKEQKIDGPPLRLLLDKAERLGFRLEWFEDNQEYVVSKRSQVNA